MFKHLPPQVVMAFVLVLASSTRARPEQIGAIDKPIQDSWAKAENGLIISWHRGVSTDKSASRINIYNLQGRSLSTFEILSLVPEAEGVSIHDVSARPGMMVAVAAVYESRQNQPSAAVLLYLDFRGTLVSALALAPSREVDALALDDELNVWTLVHSAADDDPGHSPLIVEYSKTGEVLREVFTRNQFPPHERSIRQNPEAGAVAAGFQRGTFWFWLPQSTEFVTIRTTDGAVLNRSRTGLPEVAGQATSPLQIVSASAGNLVAEIRIETDASTTNGEPAYYTWSAQTKSWSPFNPECDFHRLIGTGSNELIFLRFNTVNTVCSYRR